MPTAAKLVASLAFAVIGYALFTAMVPIYADVQAPGWLILVCIGSGLLVGWNICGANARDVMSGIGNGYTAIVALGLIIITVISFMTMLERSMRRRYDGPMDALVGHFGLMYENFIRFGTLEVGIIMLIGGAVAGGLAGLVGRRFGRQ